MPRVTTPNDAYGQAMLDRLAGKPAYEVCERDDGYVGVASGPDAYLAPLDDWPAFEREAIGFARGRVLDVGCGAGRVALHLQEQGLDVVGIDISPLAVKVCRRRGVNHARVLSVTQVTRKLGRFDTIVMYGNNFGLMGGWRRGRWLLRRFHGLTADDARIIAESRDPYATDEACHVAYQKRNRRLGRMAGQLRLRVRYQTLATPWFDYLLASPDEMRDLVDGTGWRVTRVFEGDGGSYAGLIEKDQA